MLYGTMRSSWPETSLCAGYKMLPSHFDLLLCNHPRLRCFTSTISCAPTWQGHSWRTLRAFLLVNKMNFCRNVSELHWSPAGRNIVLAGLASTQGSLEFFNVDDMATLRLQAHFMCNNVRWDQSGRYVCSWVDASRDMDHGYVMWSFTGEILYRCVLGIVSHSACCHCGIFGSASAEFCHIYNAGWIVLMF